METEVTMPNGTVLAFPDTMSQGDMQAAAAKYWQDQQGAAQQGAPDAGSEVNAPASQAPAEAEIEATQGGYSIVSTDRGRFLIDPEGRWSPVEVDGSDGGGFLDRAIKKSPSDLERAANLAHRAEGQALGLVDGNTAGFAGSVLKGVPFVGSYADEAVGALHGALGGDGELRTQQARDSVDTFEIANPNTALGANLTGALLTAPYAIANTSRILGNGSLITKVARGMGAGGVLGGVEGAVTGAGLGEEGSRGDNAARGALWGGAAGLGLGAAIPAVGTLARSIYNAAAGRKARAAARELGMSRDVAGFVSDAVRADGTTAARNIAASGESATLGNLGNSTRALLDSVGNAPGQSSAIARQGVETIIDGNSQNFVKVMDDVLGAPQGPRATMRQIMQESATPRREAYEAAFASPINYASDAGRNIEAAMRRVDPTDLQAAVREANAQMRDVGGSNAQIRATISDAGDVVFDQLPDVRQLNALKIGLDTIAENSKNPFGVMSPQGVRAASQARALRDALGEAVPAYREALRMGGDAIAERNAVEIGRNMLRPQFTREQMAEAIDGFGEAEMMRVRQGLRSQIDDTMANVRRGLTRSDSDPQSVLAPLRQLTASGAREKITSILGADDAARLFSMLDEAEQAFSMRIVGNSATATRTQMEKAMRELVPQGISGQIAENGLTGPLRSLAAKAANAGGETNEQALGEVRSQIARILTDTGNVGPRVSRLNEFADLGPRFQRGRATAERIGQQVAVGTAPAGVAVGTRPVPTNRAAILRRLAELEYTDGEILEILAGGAPAITEALTR